MEEKEIEEVLKFVRDYISGDRDDIPIDLVELYWQNPDLKEAYDNDPVIKEFHEDLKKGIDSKTKGKESLSKCVDIVNKFYDDWKKGVYSKEKRSFSECFEIFKKSMKK